MTHVTPALDGAVELLERSLGYTRGMLAEVRPDRLGRPTPCRTWRLGALLAHMEDALDAFTDAAAGYVSIEPVRTTGDRVTALRDKACALLGAWTAARPPTVRIGDLELESPILVATAALEITVHGWDVGQSTERDAPIPEDLARGLLGVAGVVIGPSDRDSRFAPPRLIDAGESSADRLLAWTGRDPAWARDQTSEPPGANRWFRPRAAR